MSMAPRLQHYLDDHQAKYDLLTHPRAYTAKSSAHAAHIPSDHMAKAVVLKDSGSYVMIVTCADHKIRLNTIQSLLSRELEMVSEEEIKMLFDDCAAGAIPPFGDCYQIEAWMDDYMLSLADIYFEAGDHESLIHMDGDQFRRLVGTARHGHLCTLH